MTKPSDSGEKPVQGHRGWVADLSRSAKRLVRGVRRKTARERDAAIGQLEVFARDLTAAYVAEKRKSRELERAYHETARRLMRAVQMKDKETGAHIRRLSAYAESLSVRLGLSGDEVERIAAAAPLHDLGKIGVPDAVLQKPASLNVQEWDLMKRHCAFGASLLKGSASPLIETAKLIALTHHERWDGSGYPRGLTGNQIPMCGRIVMLVDQYDAIRSPRCYKPAFSHSHACDTILNGDERTLPVHFDPQLLSAFRDVHREFESIYARISD